MVPICIRSVPSYGTPLQSCSNFKKKKIRNELLYQLYARVGNQEFQTVVDLQQNIEARLSVEEDSVGMFTYLKNRAEHLSAISEISTPKNCIEESGPNFTIAGQNLPAFSTSRHVNHVLPCRIRHR